VVSAPIPGDGVAAGRGGVDYLLGGDAGLLFSRSGGDAGRASRVVLNPRRRVSRPSTIAVTGRLAPARGNERVTVSALAPGSTRWQHQTVRTAANGAFTTSWRVRRGTTRFVAQWAGDFRSAGDGSAPLAVRVGARIERGAGAAVTGGRAGDPARPFGVPVVSGGHVRSASRRLHSTHASRGRSSVG
jgi:hypothetical protein